MFNNFKPKMFLKGIFFLLLITGLRCDPNERPIVKSPLGQIRGYYKESYGGKKFSAFEGIPYAKPPTGARRFKEPEPVEPWTGTWDAIIMTECAQTGLVQMNVAQGDEDCLYVNVYVPRDHPDPNEELDVIVHVHGGAFMLGSGHSYAHPEYFMDRDVIFITFNYRLSILGFLSTEDDVVSGNNGLKDQVQALKWVQENIASFGGNPRSVTLTGLSAGGASVHLHYLSPMSEGLFHRGFSQSGVATNPWVIQEEPLKKARMLARAVGCPDAPSQEMVDCLRERPIRQILTKVPHYYGFMFTPFSPFAPVVEKGSNPFLDKNPYYLLAKGKIHDLPWIASNTKDEGLFPAIFFRKNLEEIDVKWPEVAPFLLDFNYTMSNLLFKETAKQIKDFYFGSDGHISMENFDKFVKMFSDRLFLADGELAVKWQARNNKSPVYYYLFTYSAEHNENKTVSHGDDGQYFFYNMFGRKPSPNDEKVKDIVLEMLTSFAKTGKPEIEGVLWEPTGHQELNYLNISSYERSEIKQQTIKELSPTAFWSSQGFLENQNLVLIKDEL